MEEQLGTVLPSKQGGQGKGEAWRSRYRRTIEKRDCTTENQARDARRTDKEEVRVRRISRKIDKGKQGQCYADSAKQYSRRAVKARGMIAKARRRGMSEGVVLYCENETLKSRGQ